MERPPPPFSISQLTVLCLRLLRYVFGVKANVRNGLSFAEEKSVVYAAGHNIIKHYIDNNQQEFIPGSDSSLGITSLAVSSSKR